MSEDWLVYEQTFLRMQYTRLSVDIIAKALNRSIDDIKIKAREMNIKLLGVEEEISSKPLPLNTKGYRYRKSLEEYILSKVEDRESVVVNINQISNFWNINIKQARFHLYNMFDDDTCKVKATNRDKAGNYLFKKKAYGEKTPKPDVQSDILTDINDDIKHIERNIPIVSWNATTDRVVEYLYNKVCTLEKNHAINIINKDIVRDLGLGLNTVKNHIQNITNNKDCLIERIIIKHNMYTLNYYKLKNK